MLATTGTVTTFSLAGCLGGGSGDGTTIETRYMDAPGLEDYFEKHTEIFEEETGIRVEYETIGWGEAQERLLTDITSQTGPDVQEIASTWIPEQADAGGWMDLESDEVVDHIPNTEMFEDGAMDVATFQDSLVGIPWFWGPRAWQQIDEEIETGGVDGHPDDWDALVDQGQAYDGDTDLFALMGADFEPMRNFAMFLWQSGGQLLTDDNTEPAFHNEEGVRALQFYADLYTEYDVLSSETVEWGAADINGAFAGRQMASTVDALGTVSAYEDEDGHSLDDLSISAPPVGPDGDGGTFFGMELLGIHPWTDEPEAAAQWIDYLLRAEPNAEISSTVGFLPTNPDGFDTEYFDHELYESFNDEVFPVARTYPQVLGWGEIEGELNSAVAGVIQNAVTGDLEDGDIEDALEDAADVARQTL
ncbi:extracellular solute-binding protein [Halobiforma nitratireducens]|uniref:Putative extracellular solute binding protein n=1 Tax=Halobiforma nitratireducens JCM 10879 TaxID=1227454 RepID=M0MQ43_9EURY|nr:extracellular solute-binding protein [Halobiforma nitratireducens]EMA46575.1 putative extracellular solute binding protein [Halobiforma nitratireducens JCM 10879]